MSARLPLHREADVAAEWDMPIRKFRDMRVRHGWAHVEFSRQDIRYTDAQLEQIVRDMTHRGSTRRPKPNQDSGQTSRSAATSRRAS